MTAEPKAAPFLFVVGCPRSGTTLLQRMLDNHPELAVANDTHFIPRCVERVAPWHLEQRGEAADPPLTRDLLEAVVGYKRISRLGLTEQEIRFAARQEARFSTFVGRLYARIAERQEKRHGGEKTPDYVRRLPWLTACFPRTKVLHIVRDGRDVAQSLFDWATPEKGPGRLERWKREPVMTAASWWSWQVLEGLRAADVLPADRVLTIRYERLVDRPHEEMTLVCEFLGLPMANSTVCFHVGRQKNRPGASAKKNWLPPTKGLRDWRTQMSPADVALFEAIAGETLEETGYLRVGGTPTATVRPKVEAHRRWWGEQLERKRGKLLRRIERMKELSS